MKKSYPCHLSISRNDNDANSRFVPCRVTVLTISLKFSAIREIHIVFTSRRYAGCRLSSGMRYIYYVQYQYRVLGASEMNAPCVCNQSPVYEHDVTLHPQLVHHAYRCNELKAIFTSLNCATDFVKSRAACRHLFVCLTINQLPKVSTCPLPSCKLSRLPVFRVVHNRMLLSNNIKTREKSLKLTDKSPLKVYIVLVYTLQIS